MNTSIEISIQPTNTIEITSQSQPEISVNAGVGTTLEVAIATIGPRGETGEKGSDGTRGPDGQPGPNMIGGFGIQVSALSAGDHLRFAGSHWENISNTSLTDGGNF